MERGEGRHCCTQKDYWLYCARARSRSVGDSEGLVLSSSYKYRKLSAQPGLDWFGLMCCYVAFCMKVSVGEISWNDLTAYGDDNVNNNDNWMLNSFLLLEILNVWQIWRSRLCLDQTNVIPIWIADLGVFVWTILYLKRLVCSKMIIFSIIYSPLTCWLIFFFFCWRLKIFWRMSETCNHLHP